LENCKPQIIANRSEVIGLRFASGEIKPSEREGGDTTNQILIFLGPGKEGMGVS